MTVQIQNMLLSPFANDSLPIIIATWDLINRYSFEPSLPKFFCLNNSAKYSYAIKRNDGVSHRRYMIKVGQMSNKENRWSPCVSRDDT